MRSYQARAFAPGHLTAFFMTADESFEPVEKGSLGAGICLSKGAYSRVQVEPGNVSDIRVRINDVIRSAEVTTYAIGAMLSHASVKKWIRDEEFSIKVDTTLELPEKSGWGMSGAGALSAVLALGEVLNLPLSYFGTAYFAHLAELEHSTGLGDVVAQCTGGLTIRMRPGLPPHGFVDTIPVPSTKIVCLTLPEALSTASVLGDPEKRKKINSTGKLAVDEIIREPTLEKFLGLSRDFTSSTGLASSKLLDALEAMEGKGRGGMAMLGNSLYAFGEIEELVDILLGFGRVDVCNIEFQARVLL